MLRTQNHSHQQEEALLESGPLGGLGTGITVPRISLVVAEWKRGAEGRRVARSDGNYRGLRRSGDKEGCGHEHREDEKREDFHAFIVTGLKEVNDLEYVLKCSYGNDSIALIQWAHEQNLSGCYCLFSDTGWATDWWPARVERGEDWAKSLGFVPVRTESIGFPALVRQKQGWPMGGGRQHCTKELKIIPYQKWLMVNDPASELTVVCGVRRAESERRRLWPEWVEESEADLGRSLWSPLALYSDAQRNALILRAGWEVLPHRSKECSPCIHANKSDLIQLSEPDIAKVENLEQELGNTKKSGKPRVMFRSGRRGGASGIREVILWASEPTGHYVRDQIRFPCDSGFCGE